MGWFNGATNLWDTVAKLSIASAVNSGKWYEAPGGPAWYYYENSNPNNSLPT